MVHQKRGFAWALIVAGAAGAALQIPMPSLFLTWIGAGVLALGLVLLLARKRVRPDSRSSRNTFGDSTRSDMVGRTYEAITRFTAGRGRIRVNNGSFGAVGDEAIEPGDMVEVVAIKNGRPRVAKKPAAG